MNPFSRNYLIALALGLGIQPLFAAASTPAALFQEAVMKESGERDPEAAVPLYEKVIDQSGTDRQLRFKARFHLASCYELLGRSKEAEQIYLQIIGESASVSSEIVQEALDSLRKLQAREKVSEPTTPQKNLVLGSRFNESRFSFAAGGAYLLGDAQSRGRGTASFRYRILPGQPPLSLYMEAGTVPVGNDTVANQNKTFDAQTNDHGSLHLQFQSYLAFISELPHGQERWVIPEGGVGVALTSMQTQVTSFTNDPSATQISGTQTAAQVRRRSFSPYFSAGLHFFPDHLFSLIFQGSYVACPNPGAVAVPAQNFSTTTTTPHTQTFNFPSSFWDLSLKVQIKFGRTKLVLEQGS